MNKIHWKAVARYTLLLLVVGFLASYCAPAAYQICKKTDASGAKDCAQYHFGPFVLLSVAEVLNAYNGLITAISTVFLTWITLRLARMEEDSGATQRAELRAYISGIPKGITVEPDKETLKIWVQIKNAGQTPAFNVMVPTGIVVLPPGERFKVGDIKITDAQIADLPPVTLPKESGSMVSPTVRFTYADRIRFMSEPNRIYVYGLVTYQDIFGLSQWVEFCHYLDFGRFNPFFSAAAQAPLEKFDISFKVAEFGNDTSLNPQHRPQMQSFWAKLGERF